MLGAMGHNREEREDGMNKAKAASAWWSYTRNRPVRFVEIWRIFGPWDKLTWMTLFPPYHGWDVGCGYCAMEGDAMKARRCDRAQKFGYQKCGTTERELPA